VHFPRQQRRNANSPARSNQAVVASASAHELDEPAFSVFSEEAKRFPLILTLDQNGIPHRWITWQHTVWYYAKQRVAWETGSKAFTVNGGKCRETGETSTVTAASIIAIRGKAMAIKGFNQVPPLNNRELFHRDRQICAYCGGLFTHSKLTRDHIIPYSRRGQDTWMNVVTSCRIPPPFTLLLRRTKKLLQRILVGRRPYVTGKPYQYTLRVQSNGCKSARLMRVQ